MDPSQTKAFTALQPFIHLVQTTSSPSPRFLADLITHAISAQGTYVFSELLQLEPIQSLRASAEFKNRLTLLEIFSWGTWEEYQGKARCALRDPMKQLTHISRSATSGLPPLDETQALKLRQLTLLTLSASPTFALTYTNLMSALSLSSISELESLITTTNYAGLITARLSPTTTPPMVHITSTAPLRDLRPLSLPHLLKVLETWDGRCTSVIHEIESHIEGIKTAARKRKTKESARDDALEIALKEYRAEAKDAASMATSAGNANASSRFVGNGGGNVGGGRRGVANAGFPVRTGGSKFARGANKRDLEDTEDDSTDVFEEAAESASASFFTEGRMDIDEPPTSSTAAAAAASGAGIGGRMAKRRGG